MSMNNVIPGKKHQQHHMPALTGIRFFAILHIFCFHLWTLYDMEKQPGVENLLRDMSNLPAGLLTYLSNGWMSTSFFFLLSGFILAYLYWGADGKITVPKKTFWLARATRIYPIHILLVLVSFLGAGYHLSNGVSPSTLVASAMATLVLVQAWFPDFVPLWSWPTWTISALVFLYGVMPFLMPMLARLSRRNASILLCSLPLISLIPTAVYALYFPAGTEPQQFWQIFIGSTPIFWLAHFVAGMLLTKVFALSKYNAVISPVKKSWFAWGDIALVAVIVIACVPGIEEPFKYFLRHGLLMPLYMIIIVDLAQGKGVAARFFSLPWMGFLGETGFSIFIWQNFVMMVCWMMIMLNPNAGDHQFLGAVVATIALAIFSTYLLEQPFAKWLRRKFIQ
jgi:peptidoglycan/LPS O-acetylase OafA/YrhL